MNQEKLNLQNFLTLDET